MKLLRSRSDSIPNALDVVFMFLHSPNSQALMYLAVKPNFSLFLLRFLPASCQLGDLQYV